MTADTDLHPLARTYLDRLTSAARGLPPDRAEELVADIREHLREATGRHPGEAEVRTTIDRLGTPEELVLAAGGGATSGPGPAQRDRLGAVEVIALVCLLGSELLFFLFPLTLPLWLAGVVLLLVSGVWSWRQKAWGAAALATGFPLVFATMVVPVNQTSTACYGGTAVQGAPSDAVLQPDGTLCVTEGGWPEWAMWLTAGLLVAYLCWQVWALWWLSRRR